MKRVLILAALLMPTVAFAQQSQQQVPPTLEAVQLAYRQLGIAVGQALDKAQADLAAEEAQKATLIEWLKAAQAEAKISTPAKNAP